MPNFATDRDLLALEPNLFRDAGWTSQRLASGTGDVADTTLTMSSQDVTFTGANVTTGHVATIDGLALEIISRTSASQLQISRLRANTADPAIPAPSVSNKPVQIYTFGPQIAIAHRQILGLIGIDGSAAPAVGVITEASVTNPAMLKRAEVLAALNLIYSALAGVGGPDSIHGRGADWYRDQLGLERQRTAAEIDTDGDGIADATRRLNVIQFMRG